MARANAAAGDARAMAWRVLAKSMTQPLNEGARAKPLAIEPWLRLVLPAAAFVFLALLTVAAISHIRSERHRAIEASAREVELRASILAMSLDRALAAAPDQAPGDLLRAALGASSGSRRRGSPRRRSERSNPGERADRGRRWPNGHRAARRQSAADDLRREGGSPANRSGRWRG